MSSCYDVQYSSGNRDFSVSFVLFETTLLEKHFDNVIT